MSASLPCPAQKLGIGFQKLCALGAGDDQFLAVHHANLFLDLTHKAKIHQAAPVAPAKQRTVQLFSAAESERYSEKTPSRE